MVQRNATSGVVVGASGVAPAGGAAAGGGGGLSGQLAAWARARRSRSSLLLVLTSPASLLALSLVVHLSLLGIAAAVSGGGGGEGGRGVETPDGYEVEIEATASLRAIGEAELDGLAPAVIGESELPELPTAGVMEGAGGDDAPAAGDGLGAIEEGLGGAGGGDIGEGEGLGAGGTGGGAASFFGVEARGSRFAYIVDVSGSMEGEKLKHLRAELTGSLGNLLQHMSYWVVFFASEPAPMGGKRRWVDADEQGKRWATQQIKEVAASGGTVPWGAFEMVLAMKPAPDAIYFMTDGEFDPAVVDLIALRNKGGAAGKGRVPIHCIAFGEDAAQALMRRIAEESGGSYSYVRVRERGAPGGGGTP